MYKGILCVLVSVNYLWSPFALMAQDPWDGSTCLERSNASSDPAAIRFCEMLAKFQPLATEESILKVLSNEDLSTLFEIHIDIPEINEVRVNALLFRTQHHHVDPKYLPWLDHYAATVLEYPQARIRLLAHTDSIGTDVQNQLLSELRAREVKEQLVARGVAPERIAALGLGDRQPIGSNTESNGRSMNRRVEFRTYFPVHRR